MKFVLILISIILPGVDLKSSGGLASLNKIVYSQYKNSNSESFFSRQFSEQMKKLDVFKSYKDVMHVFYKPKTVRKQQS